MAFSRKIRITGESGDLVSFGRFQAMILSVNSYQRLHLPTAIRSLPPSLLPSLPSTLPPSPSFVPQYQSHTVQPTAPVHHLHQPNQSLLSNLLLLLEAAPRRPDQAKLLFRLLQPLEHWWPHSADLGSLPLVSHRLDQVHSSALDRTAASTVGLYGHKRNQKTPSKHRFRDQH